MQITNVKIRKTFEEGPLKAIVSVTFDECFAVHDIKIVEANNRTFIIMPSVKMESGLFRDTAHPINATFRAAIEEAVLEEFEKYKALKEISE